MKEQQDMTTNTLTALAAAPPVHPRDLILPYITWSSRHLGWPGISVCHSQAPSLELDAPPLSMHAVSLALNAVPRLMQRRDGRCVDGSREQWEVQILPAGHPSYWRAEGVVENVFIALEPPFLQQVALEACDLDPARVEVQHVFAASDPVIKHLGYALWGELHTDGLGGQVYAASLAQVLAIHLLRTACVRTPILRRATGGLPRPALRRVLAYISDHLAQPITLADLAALVPMDPYHFLKAFRQAIGITPHQYLLARRMERAQALLKDSTMPITDVAFQVGFRTPSHFTWHFRRQTGVTPTAYRRAVL
jgi:AraC family transcriptional regulator